MQAATPIALILAGIFMCMCLSSARLGGRRRSLQRLGSRPRAATPRHAVATAARRPGEPRHAPAAPGPGAPARRVRRPGGRRAGPRRAARAPQHRRHRADHPPHPPAWGRGWAAGDDPVPRRGGLTAAAGPRSPRRERWPASPPCPPALAAALTDSRDRRGQAVAATATSPGRGTARPRVDVARGAPVSGAAVAPARDAGSGGYAGGAWSGAGQVCPPAAEAGFTRPGEPGWRDHRRLAHGRVHGCGEVQTNDPHATGTRPEHR
jgi:hypothetical protein